MTERHTAGLSIRVGGQPLPAVYDTALAWASVTESGSTPAAAEIGFRDPYRIALLAGPGIGLGTVIELVADSDGEFLLFRGEVTGCEARAAETGVFSVVKAEDLAHRLRRGHRTRAYQQVSASQIAEKMASLAGLEVGTVDGTDVVYEFLTQPAMSDWDFLVHLARENGRDLFVRAGQLHFAKPARASETPTTLEFGRDLVKATSAATLRDQVTEVSVRGWDHEGKKPLRADRTPARAPGREVAWQVDSAVLRGEKLVLPGLPRATQHEVEKVADAMAQEIAAGLTEVRAVVRGEPRLRLRSSVSLKGLGTQFEGRYTVTSVVHEYHPDSGYLTELTVREGTDGTDTGRPGDGEDALRRFWGLMPATVVDIQDPGHQGRVTVSLPWLAPPEEYKSTWARTVQLGGSRGHGVVLPEVGDEVLVGFEQGSLDRPYVIGGLYNGVDRLAPHSVELYDSTKGTVNRRSFASKEGHRLELLDAGGQGMGAVLTTGDGKLRIELDQHNTLVSVGSDGTIEITAAHGITLDAGKAPLELRGQSIDMNATGQVKVSGTGVEVSGKDVTVKGGARTEISAPLVKIN